LIRRIIKYWLILLAICCAGSFLFYTQTVFDADYADEMEVFQENFLETEMELDTFLHRKQLELDLESVDYLEADGQNDPFFFHVYRNDSLIYWNTNHLPVLRFADIHYPADGIVHLQNGWYYAQTLRMGNLQLVASFLIKRDYQYENRNLKNEFDPRFGWPFKANIVLEKENAYPVYNQKKNFVFAVYPYAAQPISPAQSNLLLVLLLGTVSFSLIALYSFGRKMTARTRWLPLVVVLLRIISLQWNWLGGLRETTAFQPTLYASSDWFPNFGEYLLNCLVLLYLIFVAVDLLKKTGTGRRSQWLTLLLYGIVLLYGAFMGDLYKGLVENSTIPLEIDKLFTLNFYSFLAAISMGLLFYGYFHLLRAIVQAMVRAGWKRTSLLVIWIVAAVVVFGLSITWGQQIFFLAICPIAINGFIFFNVIYASGQYRFGFGVLLLVLFSMYVSVNLRTYYDRKEKAERELFANQLASDQDIATEVEFSAISAKISADSYLHKTLSEPRGTGVSEFKDAMERRYFNGFWERYDIEFFLFDHKNEPVINYKNVISSRYATLEHIISGHSFASEIDSNIYFIKDYTSQYSYIIRQPVMEADTVQIATLYCALRSKKIPEKIGFPRLLISSRANVFESLENYSIAKYYNGKLISNNGKFSYPSRDAGLTKNLEHASGYFNNEGYNHYLLRKTPLDLIVLSRQNHSAIQLVTSFSYLFSFFGLFLLVPIYIHNRTTGQSLKGLTLAVRIQMVLIGLVFIALVAFGWGSGIFVENQYQSYTNELIREKIRSVEIEVQQRLGEEEALSINQQGNYMEYVLQKLSTVFVTDINLYDRNGYLLASSRSKIYNIGLLSEQMNPDAYRQLRRYRKSEFIHQENIGNLDYLSGYVPFYSNEGNLLAYLNLQHFGQQKGFEDQIQQFLVAIMNVFILLLALSIIVAIFVSNWVTIPLRILQKNFAGVQLGKYNQPILYAADDEIGALVKDYNQKLEELEYAAQQLAQNEREMAWREMAKQVAHEIKNPLTPMKLGLQQLQRVFDPNDPKSKEKIDRVSSSMIEQIDALTKIANEFSNFAKMPRSAEVDLDLIPLIEGVMLVFNQEENLTLTLEHSEPQAWVHADKDLMLRVFNNLVKNAIQAIPPERAGEIGILISRTDRNWLIEVRDNGKGIEEAERSKLFVPYFTTKSTGTGLGLAMVKQIIETHRGTIHYTSNPPNGTSFFVVLPALTRV
jgi:two-component system nitrogen regulation sensor histidine kinase NtrY